MNHHKNSKKIKSLKNKAGLKTSKYLTKLSDRQQSVVVGGGMTVGAGVIIDIIE